MPIFSTTLFDTISSLDIQNRLDSLSPLSDPESPVADSITQPHNVVCLSIVQDKNTAKAKATCLKPSIKNFDYDLSVLQKKEG